MTRSIFCFLIPTQVIPTTTTYTTDTTHTERGMAPTTVSISTPTTTTTGPRRCCAVCAQPDAKPCGGCLTTAYCSKTCQKQHWRAGHKRECWPLKRVVNTPQPSPSTAFHAQHTVLTRAAHPGDILLEERPLAVWPNHRAHPRRTMRRGRRVTVYDDDGDDDMAEEEEEEEEMGPEAPGDGGVYTSCMLCAARIRSGAEGTLECSECSLETCGDECPFKAQEGVHEMVRVGGNVGDGFEFSIFLCVSGQHTHHH